MFIIKIGSGYIAGSFENGYSVTSIRENAKAWDTKVEAENVKVVHKIDRGSVIPQ